MSAHYQIGRAQRVDAMSSALTPLEMFARLRDQITLATDAEDRADAERVLSKFLTLHPEMEAAS